MKKVSKVKTIGFLNKIMKIGKIDSFKLPSRHFDKDKFKLEEEDLRIQYKNIGL